MHEYIHIYEYTHIHIQVLDECASKHAGILNQERPIIGVRGKRKDMGRVVKLIKEKRRATGQEEHKPVTVILLDDRYVCVYVCLDKKNISL